MLPKPRPPELGSAGTPSLALQAMAQRDKALASAATDTSIFQRFFGKRPDAAPALAYAATDGGVFNNGQSITSGRSLASDGQTAIYDISARTVYMPDGTKLEAHSGFGDLLDDPRHCGLSRSAAKAKSMGARVSLRTPICSGRTATRTAACRSRTTTHFSRPT
jgi:hypothetical protein